MTTIELCDWTLPDDSAHKGIMTDCLGEPGHDGPHAVGHTQNGWARIYEVDLDTRILTEVVHAMLRDGEQCTREDLALLLAALQITRGRQP